MKKHLVTFLFLLVAFLFYFLGLALPAAVFMLLGFFAELVFWVRLLGGSKRKSNR